MSLFSNLVKLSVVAAAAVNAIAIPEGFSKVEKRTTVVDYDDIVGFAQTVPDTTEGTLYTAYQPFLKVVNGCVPFPAVDAAGDVRYVQFLALINNAKSNIIPAEVSRLPGWTETPAAPPIQGKFTLAQLHTPRAPRLTPSCIPGK